MRRYCCQPDEGLWQRTPTLQEPHQFAYTKNCSTANALIEVVDSWKSAIDQKQYKISVFLDLRKAFDVVDHSMLSAKLRNYAFSEVEVKWISSYLTDRQYFNYIVSSFENCNPILYVDDTEVHYSDEDLTTAQTKVNQDMMNIDHCINQNRMIANVKKTKAMLIGSRQTIK